MQKHDKMEDSGYELSMAVNVLEQRKKCCTCFNSGSCFSFGLSYVHSVYIYDRVTHIEPPTVIYILFAFLV